ncbi:MAG: preprotein translocase subunit YajC [Elusimicrobia bacterium]|nr:preprotein translocase subunit YajC [Candidatus Obscuribacterium magneticum]
MKKMTFRKALFSLALLGGQASSLFAMAGQPNADPNAPPPPAWITYMPIIFMIAVFYFLLIRPQMRQRKDHQKMVDSLKKGDKIITQGGFHATVVNIGPGFVDVKLNEDTKVKIQRSAVQQVLPESQVVEVGAGAK